jgi:hypothetical protein
VGVLGALAVASPPTVKAHSASWENVVLVLGLVALAVFLLWRHKARAGGRAAAVASAAAAARAAGGDGGVGKGGDVRTASALQVFVCLDRQFMSSLFDGELPGSDGVGRVGGVVLPVDSLRGREDMAIGEGRDSGGQLGERDFVHRLRSSAGGFGDGGGGYVPAAVSAGGNRGAADGLKPLRVFCGVCGSQLPVDGSPCPCVVGVSHD